MNRKVFFVIKVVLNFKFSQILSEDLKLISADVAEVRECVYTQGRNCTFAEGYARSVPPPLYSISL